MGATRNTARTRRTFETLKLVSFWIPEGTSLDGETRGN